MLVGFPCGCQTGGVDASRLERSGGGGTTIVLMSGSDCGSGSLVAVVWMLAFVGVWGVGFYGSRALFPSAPRRPHPCID